MVPEVGLRGPRVMPLLGGFHVLLSKRPFAWEKHGSGSGAETNLGAVFRQTTIVGLTSLTSLKMHGSWCDPQNRKAPLELQVQVQVQRALDRPSPHGDWTAADALNPFQGKWRRPSKRYKTSPTPCHPRQPYYNRLFLSLLSASPSPPHTLRTSISTSISTSTSPPHPINPKPSQCVSPSSSLPLPSLWAPLPR